MICDVCWQSWIHLLPGTMKNLKGCQISSWDDSPRATSQKRTWEPQRFQSQDAPNQSLSRNRNRMEVFFQVITLKILRSAGVLDSKPGGMLGFNRLLVMLEPVTTLSDDDHEVPAAKSAAKAKSKAQPPSKAPPPKSSPPKRPSPPETVPSPKQKSKAQAKAKSSSSHPPMKRPSAQAKSKASTASAPTPPSAPPPKKGMKRPAATSELRVSKYFYKSTKIWGFKLNGAEKFRVSHLQTFLRMFDFSTLFMGCGDLLEVKPMKGYRLRRSKKSLPLAWQNKKTFHRQPNQNLNQ